MLTPINAHILANLMDEGEFSTFSQEVENGVKITITWDFKVTDHEVSDGDYIRISYSENDHLLKSITRCTPNLLDCDNFVESALLLQQHLLAAPNIS